MSTPIDFCGFTWKGKHSSDMGVVRVSDGSRYNDTILPSLSDTTATVPGRDGALYWESFYTNKPISINIAFDNLSEKQYQELRVWLNAKDRGELIYDESPYKAYTVKIKDPPQLKTICFGSPRVYKGEGTISFVAYYPFARGRYKFKDDVPGTITNREEWADASHLIDDTKKTYNNPIQNNTTYTINLYNAGDLETDFKLILNLKAVPTQLKLKVGNATSQLNLAPMEQGNDTYIRFNSATRLIEGGTKENGVFKTSGNLYNKFVTKGDWFKIPVSNGEGITLTITFTTATTDVPTLEYEYLYY